MKPINVLIVENPNSVEIDLPNRLSSLGFTVKKMLANPLEIDDYVSQHAVDIILMDDFSQHSPSGTKIAEEIHKTYHTPILLLVSDDKFQMEESIGFPILFKPTKDQELFHHILREINISSSPIIQESNTMQTDLFVRSDYKLNKIRIADIYYVEALKDYIMIHTENNVYKVHSTIKNVSKHLQAPNFIRIHRSFIVNKDRIASIKYPELVIEDKMKVLPIGGLYRKELIEQLNIL
jgi:DNA-binding LytR/AlgR family response regulator